MLYEVITIGIDSPRQCQTEVSVKPARTDRPLHYPERWTDIPHGEWLAAEIQERLNAWCP